MGNCSRLNQTKNTGQLNAMHNPHSILNPKQIDKKSIAIRDIIGTIGKSEYGL